MSQLNKKVYDYLKENYPPDTLDWAKGVEWVERDVPLATIDMLRRPGGRNMTKVRNIAREVAGGKKMDPVVLVDTPKGRKIADGYHRTLGFQHAGKKTIRAYIAKTDAVDGPWNTDMHAKKKNVEPGKTASEAFRAFEKAAR